MQQLVQVSLVGMLVVSWVFTNWYSEYLLMLRLLLVESVKKCVAFLPGTRPLAEIPIACSACHWWRWDWSANIRRIFLWFWNLAYICIVGYIKAFSLFSVFMQHCILLGARRMLSPTITFTSSLIRDWPWVLSTGADTFLVWMGAQCWVYKKVLPQRGSNYKYIYSWHWYRTPLGNCVSHFLAACCHKCYKANQLWAQFMLSVHLLCATALIRYRKVCL